MNLNLPEGRTQLRELIRTLGEKMRERGDAWLLKDCTTREDSWYNRHLRLQKKKAEAKQEDTEKEKEAPKERTSLVCSTSEIGPICGHLLFRAEQDRRDDKAAIFLLFCNILLFHSI